MAQPARLTLAGIAQGRCPSALVVGHRVAAALAQTALHDAGSAGLSARDEQRLVDGPNHVRAFPRAGVLRIECAERRGSGPSRRATRRDRSRVRRAAMPALSRRQDSPGLRHRQIVVLLAQQHQDRRAGVAALLGDAAIDPRRIEGDVRREPRLARQQGGAQSLESRQIGDLAAEREADDGDAIGVDVGMRRPAAGRPRRPRPRPTARPRGGSAVDQAAHAPCSDRSR